jgi:hypothetical protein
MGWNACVEEELLPVGNQKVGWSQKNKRLGKRKGRPDKKRSE